MCDSDKLPDEWVCYPQTEKTWSVFHKPTESLWRYDKNQVQHGEACLRDRYDWDGI